MSNILVTGATGQLGKAVTESLLKKTAASNIHILARDAAKAANLKAQGVTVHIGDYGDYASLVSAFKGIDKVYMVSGNDLHNRIKQQDNVVNAAKEAGVKHVVYTSYQRKNETDSSPIAFVAAGHLNTEAKLKASGLTYTILQHGIYADMVPIFAGEQVLHTKTIYLPAGDGKTAYAVRTDQAEAGANVLLDTTGKYNNQSIELGGPEALSWQQVADIIGDITSEKINYVSPSVAEFDAALTKAGVPAEYIGLFASFSQAGAQGEFENVTTNLEIILGRKPLTVAAFLSAVYKK
ncbi:SDR family oxidoreductase [Mucilaginibacter sp. X4EP1]|jgi:NAD(P)H dehydrogenase (quinone)|uniref:SDR family oxidoreductase n=1 Tax=Mucilaginibacter sp. X4EP1 TaxID=2723092 RepID=UPI00216932CF|nr:SDR family oxidoreductase [Mucilaginibacter sp. X4EP1]MCS3815945.1 NAD(P)H dehydrogenase (quinone) [Mucilaginibacter sp. X4EP1]